MTDHYVDGKADYSLQWKGLHDGKLFIRGFEMNNGFMPWGLPDTEVFSSNDDPHEIAREVAKVGGVLFYAHSEEERIWDLPELTGIEIYNIHTNLIQMQQQHKLLGMLPVLLLNNSAYPDECFRCLFTRQTDILQHWDELNGPRKIVGIAANDTHQNTGIRGYYTDHGTFLVKKTDKDILKEFPLNSFSRTLLRLCFGPLEPGKQLFRWELDPYIRSVRFVSTHVLAKELTEPGILDALRQGRVFIGFDMIADSKGFKYFAESQGNKAVMGETIAFAPDLRLRAGSPEPCRFTVVKNGHVVHQVEGVELDWKPDGPGKYRIEAELSILDQWTPWVYTNPIAIE
jgi:hypothetical protein